MPFNFPLLLLNTVTFYALGAISLVVRTAIFFVSRGRHMWEVMSSDGGYSK